MKEFQKMNTKISEAFIHKACSTKKSVIIWHDTSKEGGLSYTICQGKMEECKPRKYLVSCGSTCLTEALGMYYIMEPQLIVLVYTLENAKHFTLGAPEIIL